MTPRGRQLLGAVGLLSAAACVRVASAHGPAPEFWAFTGPWDRRSAASATTHQRQLDAVVSGWIGLDSITGAPYLRYPDSLSRRRSRRMALVTSESNERFRPELVRVLAGDGARLAAAARWIAIVAARGGYSGLVLDFEGHPAADLPAVLGVVRAITDSAHAHGVRRIAVAIPAADTLAYPARPFVAITDAVLVMLYDEHWNRAAPGPIASPAWVRRWLDVRVREVGAAHVVAGFPTYGYQWRTGVDSAAATVGFLEARALAAQGRTRLAPDPGSGTLRAISPDGWELWIADASLLDSLVGIARARRVSRIALWRLGLEDPAVWTRVVRRRR